MSLVDKKMVRKLIAEDTIDDILECKPDIGLASSPPIYLEDYMKGRTEKAWDNALKLAKGGDIDFRSPLASIRGGS